MYITLRVPSIRNTTRPLGRFAPVAGYSGLRPETRKCLPTKAQFALREREKTLKQAFFSNPKRFKGRLPKPPELPTAVWINPPLKQEKENINPIIP